MNSEFQQFLPIFMLIVLVVVFAALAIGGPMLIGKKRTFQKVKDQPYECGLPSEHSSHIRFGVKFYLVAMIFILFDIEVVFLIPWTFVYRDFLANHIAILSPMLFFLFVLVLGLFYEVKKGALEWEK